MVFLKKMIDLILRLLPILWPIRMAYYWFLKRELTTKEELRDVIRNGEFECGPLRKDFSSKLHITKDFKIYDYSSIRDISYMFVTRDPSVNENVKTLMLDLQNISNIKGAFKDLNYMKECRLYDMSKDNKKDFEGKFDNFQEVFSGCYRLKKSPFKGKDFKSITNMDSMFQSCGKLEGFDEKLETGNVEFMGSAFSCCDGLKEIPKLDFSKVTSAHELFYKILPYKESDPFFFKNVVLDLSNASDLSGLFADNEYAKVLPKIITTSKLRSTSTMFRYCKNIDVFPLFNTSNVTDMSSMFQECKTLTEIPEYDTSNVVNMQAMFAGCVKLEKAPELNIKSLENLNCMFARCENLKTPLDLTKITNNNKKTYFEIYYGTVFFTETYFEEYLKLYLGEYIQYKDKEYIDCCVWGFGSKHCSNRRYESGTEPNRIRYGTYGPRGPRRW
jgi:surface protein